MHAWTQTGPKTEQVRLSPIPGSEPCRVQQIWLNLHGEIRSGCLASQPGGHACMHACMGTDIVMFNPFLLSPLYNTME